MYNLIRSALILQKSSHKINKVKLYSFRKHSFNRYVLLLLRTYRLFSGQLFLAIQTVKYNSLLHTIYVKQFVGRYINVINIVFSTNFLFDLYYFNSDFNIQNIDTIYSSTFNFTNPISIYYELLQLIYLFFITFVFTTNFSFSVSSLPNIRKLFTLLRSPHTDKKSREQFSIITYSKLITMSFDMHLIFNTLIRIFGFTTLFVQFKKNLLY